MSVEMASATAYLDTSALAKSHLNEGSDAFVAYLQGPDSAATQSTRFQPWMHCTSLSPATWG
jgi:hypothetical protein